MTSSQAKTFLGQLMLIDNSCATAQEFNQKAVETFEDGDVTLPLYFQCVLWGLKKELAAAKEAHQRGLWAQEGPAIRSKIDRAWVSAQDYITALEDLEAAQI